MPSCRAFSAKAMGNRPLPAKRPMGAAVVGVMSVPVIGEPRGLSPRFLNVFASELATGGLRPSARPKTSLLVRHSQMLLDAAKVLADVGQLFEAQQDALLLALRRGGGAEHALAGRDVAGHAGLGTDHR